jgi:hypothetical protein
VLATTLWTPLRAKCSIANAASGRFATGTMGLGRRSVSGRRRVPSPAAKSMACTWV